jgi:molybdate transport system substrate-binding protein
MRSVFGFLKVIAVGGLFAIPSGVYAQEKIKVLADGPLRPALVNIGEAFRRYSGHEVEFAFGSSPLLHRKVSDGEAADVLITQPNLIDELVKAGKVVSGEHPVIGRAGIGLAVRPDLPVPNISTSEALKRTVLNADSLAYTELASGLYFATLMDRLGVAAQVKGKTARYPSSAAVFEHVLKGRANDIGVGVITLIIATKSLKLVGPLPPEVQDYIVYAAAPLSSAKSPEAAKAFISFLTTPAAKAVFAATGVE